MMKELLQQLIEVGAPVVALLVTYIFAQLAGAIRRRMGVGAGLDAALELTHVTERVVRDIGQRVRPGLEDAAGKLTPEAAKDLKDEAKEAIKATLSEAASELLPSNAARLEDVLGRAIEAEVAKTKEKQS